jgi:uncharacterized protein YqkB
MIDGYLFQVADSAPITSSRTLTAAESFAPVNAASGAISIYLLPAAETKGKRFTVKKIDSSTNGVTIDPSGSETIDDGTTATLNIQYESICIMSDGSEYWIV